MSITAPIDPVPGGTRFTVTGIIRLKGAVRLLRPLLGGLVRRRLQRLQLQPVKAAAEARAAGGRPETTRPRTAKGLRGG